MRKAEDDREKQVISDIEQYGVHIVHVLDGDDEPAASFTIGLFENYRHPEIIIIGLKRELTQVLLNNMAYEIREEGRRFPPGEYHEGVLDGFSCYFGEVPKPAYPAHVGWALWFYEGDNFPLVQCIPPTVKGLFPWDDDFPEDARFFLKVISGPPKGTGTDFLRQLADVYLIFYFSRDSLLQQTKS